MGRNTRKFTCDTEEEDVLTVLACGSYLPPSACSQKCVWRGCGGGKSVKVPWRGDSEDSQTELPGVMTPQQLQMSAAKVERSCQKSFSVWWPQFWWSQTPSHDVTRVNIKPQIQETNIVVWSCASSGVSCFTKKELRRSCHYEKRGVQTVLPLIWNVARN